MSAYFFNVTKEERENILDKHKTLYNGYAVNNQTSNMQPLYTQDFANDKEGVTVNSRGEVKKFGHMGINEQRRMEDTFEDFDLSKLEKGKKYKYKTPAFDDTVEFEDEVDYPTGDKHFSFKGDKGDSHLMGGKHIEDFMSDIDEDKKICDECGLYEDVCECGKGYSEMDENLYKETRKFPKHQSFDYIEEEDMEEGLFDFFDDDYKDLHDYLKGDDEDDVELSDENEFESIPKKIKSGHEPEDIDWEDIDDDIKESFINEKNKINEMFEKFKKYN